jgi:trk system potassium uptake protein TrkH
LNLHSKITLLTSLSLLSAPVPLFLLFEWHNTLAGLSWGDKVLASFFQVATPRTAGFNTLAYGDMGSPALLLTMFLRFIGGSPGSTAGGIKTVTLFVVMVTAWHLMRGSSTVVLFGRTLALETAMKASVLTIIAATVIGISATGLFFIQPDSDTLALAFEAVSAFSTVGLSVGVSSELNTGGKLIIIGLMYLGRLGPLTLALAFIQTRPGKTLEYPHENVLIG